MNLTNVFFSGAPEIEWRPAGQSGQMIKAWFNRMPVDYEQSAGATGEGGIATQIYINAPGQHDIQINDQFVVDGRVYAVLERHLTKSGLNTTDRGYWFVELRIDNDAQA